MALQKQQVPISFEGGIDSKSDDKQSMPTKLLELENGVFTKKGAIQKRNGYRQLSRNILGGGSLTIATGLANFQDELSLFTGTELYSYISASESWKLKGNATSVAVSSTSIVRNVYQQTDADYAYNSGYSAHVWKDSSGGCRYSIIDESSGTILVENQSLSATGTQPRVVGIGSYFYILFREGSLLKFRHINIATPQSISSAVAIKSNIHPTNSIFDVQLVGDRCYIAYNTNAGGGALALFYLNDQLGASSTVTYAGEVPSSAISVSGDSTNVYVSYNNGTSTKYLIRSADLLTVVLAPTTVEAASSVRNLASIVVSGELRLLSEISQLAGNYLRKSTASVSGSVTNAGVWKRSVGLSSKFFQYLDQQYIVVAHSSTLQSTYFVYSWSGDIITKISQNLGGGYTASSILPTAVSTADGVFKFPTLRKGQLQAEDGVLFTSLGVNSSTLDFKSLNNFVTAELAGNLHMVGGLLQSYDGASITETGFAVFPEGVVATETAIGTGTLTAGDYFYSVVYAWIDNDGQIHRSAPSIASQINIAAGPSSVQLTIPTLRISKKQNVFIEIYRTEVNGTIFYKTTSNTSLLLNDPTVDTVTYTDNRSNTSLLSGELLYTTGGILENISPPPSSIIVNWKNRLVIKSSDDANTLWYSKVRTEGSPVEFSDLLTLNVDPVGGDITALGVLDDKLVIFKESSIHMLAGDGPNNLGEQSDFPLPQLVVGDAGCIDVNSIVTTPLGLMFKSQKGIYLLDRGLSVSYIGSEVERYNSQRITSGKLIPNVNQVRFTTESDLCLVYDYLFQQWSTFTNHEAVGAGRQDTNYAFVKNDARVLVEETGHYQDNSQPIKLKIVTSWMNMAELSGFQRFYKLLLLGTYKSKHRLRVKFGFDFNSSFIQESILDPHDVLGQTTYGEDSPYGSQAVYGGENPLYQWRFFPAGKSAPVLELV